MDPNGYAAKAAAGLDLVLAAIDADELDATATERARLEGASLALRAVSERS